MLPEALLTLLAAALAAAQARQALVLNQITSLTTQAQPRTLPASSRLALSIALCAAASPTPRFFLSNVSSSGDQGTPGAAGGPGVFEIALADGQGSWTGAFPNGGILAVDANGGSSAVPFDVGVSDGGTSYSILFYPILALLSAYRCCRSPVAPNAIRPPAARRHHRKRSPALLTALCALRRPAANIPQLHPPRREHVPASSAHNHPELQPHALHHPHSRSPHGLFPFYAVWSRHGS